MAPKSTNHRIYAVITGDIVNSTKLSPSELAHVRETLSKTVRGFSARNSDSIVRGMEFFQGDSWQLLMRDPRASLRLALLIQANLKSQRDVETWASIGIGSVDSIEKSAATSTGEAFTLSGRALEETTGYFGLTGALSDRAGDMAQWFTASLRLCSGLMRSWTRRQAEAMSVWLSLPHPTHEAVAANLDPPVTKQSASDILSGANWRYLYEALKSFQATDWQRLAGPQLTAGENACQVPDRLAGLPRQKKGKRDD